MRPQEVLAMKTMEIPRIIKVDNANSFVGIKIMDGEATLFVPAAFRVENNTKVLRKELLLFLKSISIAKSYERYKISDSKESYKENVWPIESFLWLIQDYLQNGVFYNREKQYVSDGKGKIDWKRTLHNVPIMSEGNVIYDKLICSRMTPTNDLISQVYKICVYQSQINIGWLFGYDFTIDVQQIRSINEMIYAVTKEMKQTYDDVKKIRFIHMLNVLRNISGENALSTYSTYGIENYYYVFEAMVDKIFKGIPSYEKKKYNPVGFWKINGQNEVESSNLRPDTIHKRNNEIFIIDAKMYQYGITKEIGDLPTTTSMQKQITYGDYVKKVSEEGVQIRNAFVLPYDKTSDKFMHDDNIVKFNDNNLAYIGEAYVSWRNEEVVEEFDYVYTFLIDFNYLLNSYLGCDNTNIDILCDEINSRIEAKKKLQIYI